MSTCHSRQVTRSTRHAVHCWGQALSGDAVWWGVSEDWEGQGRFKEETSGGLGSSRGAMLGFDFFHILWRRSRRIYGICAVGVHVLFCRCQIILFSLSVYSTETLSRADSGSVCSMISSFCLGLRVDVYWITISYVGWEMRDERWEMHVPFDPYSPVRDDDPRHGDQAWNTRTRFNSFDSMWICNMCNHRR